jgi:hypothetical protein
MKLLKLLNIVFLMTVVALLAINRATAQPYISAPYYNNFGQDTPGASDPDFTTSETQQATDGNYWTVASPGITNDNIPFGNDDSANGFQMVTTNNSTSIYNCAEVQLQPSVIAPPQAFVISSDFQINQFSTVKESYIGLIALGNHSNLGIVGNGTGAGTFVWGEVQASQTGVHNGPGSVGFVDFENGSGGTAGITQSSQVGSNLPMNTNDVYNITVVATYDFNTNLDVTVTASDISQGLTNSKSESILASTAATYFESTATFPGNGNYFGYCDRQDASGTGHPGETNIVTQNNFNLYLTNNPSGLGDPVPISISPSPTNAFVNNAEAITATFSGATPMYFEWQYGGTNLSFTNTITGFSTNQTVLANTLSFTNIQLTNAGYYRCIGSNSLSIGNTAWTYVNVVPDPAQTMIDVQVIDAFAGGYLYQGPGVLGTPADEWNRVDVSATAVTNANIPLASSTGAPTSAELSYTPGIATFINSSLVNPLLDQFLQSTTNTIVTLTGLSPNSPYNLVVYSIGGNFQGGIVTGAVNGTSAGGPALVSNTGGFTNGINYVQNLDAVSDGSGTLTFSVAPLMGSTYSAWNGLQIVPVAISTPTVSIQAVSGGQLQVTWSGGQDILLQSTNLSGPWTTNSATSPYVFTPAEPVEFFRSE